MPISSYTELQDAVKSYAVRTDSSFAAQVTTFIRLGESRIWRRLRVSQMVSLPVTLTIVGGTNYAALPADWLAFKRIYTAAEPRIEYMAADTLWDLPSPGNAAAYSIEGGRFLYGQTPAANLPITHRYYQHPGYLSASVPTTWLLTKYPNAYLYAALLEAFVWMKNSARVDEFGTLLDKELTAIKSEDDAAMISGGALRAPGRW